MTRLACAAALVLLFISCARKDKIIGIQVYGKFNHEFVDSIKKSIHEIYGYNTIILTNKTLPSSAFINVKSPRYRADSLLRILKRNKPDSIDFVLGLISRDISTTKRDKNGDIKKPAYKYADWGVFGLGYRPGPSCIISNYRIKNSDQNLNLQRLRKVCIHELGHNFGLKHCEKSDKCVMRDAAETIRTVDQVDLKLCTYCQNRIK
ncbi:MAG: archaemetzincin [Glaciecola sp.]|jgi:archaemetzincin